MADAFVYMMVVGSGTATGVAIVGIVTWKIVLKMMTKQNKKNRKRSIV